MTTRAELFHVLRYRCEVDNAGARKYYNARGLLHCEDVPAVIWRIGTKWYTEG